MDTQEQMTITGSDGSSVTLPLVNFLRLTMVKLQPLFMQYLQETKKSDITGFNDWIKDILGTRGKNVLL